MSKGHPLNLPAATRIWIYQETDRRVVIGDDQYLVTQSSCTLDDQYLVTQGSSTLDTPHDVDCVRVYRETDGSVVIDDEIK